MRCILIAIAGACLSSMAPVRPAHSSIAYVVFERGIVAVDVDQHRVIKRLDFSGHLRPATTAALVDARNLVLVAGTRADGAGWESLEIDPIDMVIRRTTRLNAEPFEIASPQEPLRWSEGKDRAILVSYVRGPLDSLVKRSLDIMDTRTLRSVHRIEILPDKELCPSEEISSCAVSTDGRQFLVLTSGGYKEQSLLHCYTLPSVTPVAKVQLLEIWDDVPIQMLVP